MSYATEMIIFKADKEKILNFSLKVRVYCQLFDVLVRSKEGSIFRINKGKWFVGYKTNVQLISREHKID